VVAAALALAGRCEWRLTAGLSMAARRARAASPRACDLLACGPSGRAAR
jgi:hypothetical protein